METTDDESLKGVSVSRDGDDTSVVAAQRQRNEEQLRLAGLRRRNLVLLFAWLAMIALLALLLLMVGGWAKWRVRVMDNE